MACQRGRSAGPRIRVSMEKQKQSVDAISSSDARLIPRIDSDLGLTTRNLDLALVLSAPIVDALRSSPKINAERCIVSRRRTCMHARVVMSPHRSLTCGTGACMRACRPSDLTALAHSP
jgi:hypothetical protein